jgi:hypothetical protein
MEAHEMQPDRPELMPIPFNRVEKFVGKRFILVGDFYPIKIELLHEVANRPAAWWFGPVLDNGIRDGSKLGIIEPSDMVKE